MVTGDVASLTAFGVTDVQRFKSAALTVSVADELDPWVRTKFLELWQLAQVPDPF